VREFELKGRTGVYDAPREILNSKPSDGMGGGA
jgi:hypothetical protein